MIDIHTHLHFKDYDADRDAVIARARESGVEKMILVGTDLESSRAAVGLAEKHGFLFASVGMHPHEFNQPTVNSQQKTVSFRASLRVEESTGHETDPSTTLGMTEGDDGELGWIAEFRELAKHPKVVAIGECGLDYFVRKEPAHSSSSSDSDRQETGSKEQGTLSNKRKEVQKKGFLAQIKIAKDLGLPMIIHTRPSAGTMPVRNDSQAKRSDSVGDAYEDVFEILSDSKFEIRNSKFVLHCYQGDTEITKKFLGLSNVYFSFAGSITYPVKKALVGTKDDPAEVLKMIPMERMFVETDCPYLTPQPVRGMRNEPAYVLMTAEKIADIKVIDRDDISRQVSGRFSEVFSRSKLGAGKE